MAVLIDTVTQQCSTIAMPVLWRDRLTPALGRQVPPKSQLMLEEGELLEPGAVRESDHTRPRLLHRRGQRHRSAKLAAVAITAAALVRRRRAALLATGPALTNSRATAGGWLRRSSQEACAHVDPRAHCARTAAAKVAVLRVGRTRCLVAAGEYEISSLVGLAGYAKPVRERERERERASERERERVRE